MHGGGHDIGVRDRRRVQTRGDQTGEVRHIDPQVRADLIGDLAEGREIQLPRVRRPSGDDHLRSGLPGDLAHLVHIDAVIFLGDAVGVHLVQLAREVQAHTVREVTAVREIQAEQLLARAHQRHQHRGIGLRTRVRLHVRILRPEEFGDAGAGEILDDVDVLAAAVVAAARVALGVLVGEHAALRLQDRARHEVLRGDHLEGVALAGEFAAHRGSDLGIELSEGLGIDRGGRLRHGAESIGRGRSVGQGVLWCVDNRVLIHRNLRARRALGGTESPLAQHPGARCGTSVLPGGYFHLECASRGAPSLSRTRNLRAHASRAHHVRCPEK